MIRVFTPSLRGSGATGLTLCRTRLVHAKVEKKEKYKSVPHFPLFFDVMFFFFLSLSSQADFLIPYFIFLEPDFYYCFWKLN